MTISGTGNFWGFFTIGILLGVLGYRLVKLEMAVSRLKVKKQEDDSVLELEDGKDV